MTRPQRMKKASIMCSLFLFVAFLLLLLLLNYDDIEAQPESINVQNTIVTAPLTVIVPITGDIQNAQICVSAGSSGDQSCTQLIVNPEQKAYTPVSTDLATGTPTVSTAVQQEPAAVIETTNTPTITELEQVPQTSTSTPPPQTEPAPSTTNEETPQSQPSEEGGRE